MHAKRLRLPFFAMLTMATVLMLTQAQAGEVRLAWDPPTTNADGTPLKDLAGYRIHWGQSSRSYNGTKQVGKGVTSVTIADLGEGKTYYFAATAFDLAGNESKYSNEVSTTIPLADTDGDSLTDRDERELYGTDPTLTDTDGDGLDDGDEAALWGSAWLDDADKDGIINLLDSDSDNDGFADGFEHSQGFDPADPTVHPNSTDVILPVQTVAASAWEAPNVPGNTLDGTLSTRWAAQGDGQWIMYDLGTLRTVSQVTAAWYQGNQRQSFFTIEVSSNGTTWTEVYSGNSSGKTLELEPYSFAAVSARYVRIVGYGNTVNRWISLTEVEIYGQQDTGELPEPEAVLPVQTVTASAWQAPNVPANTRDEALNTRWSAEGDGQWVTYDLGTPKTVSQVAIAWYQGNQRQSFFAIEVSSNGTTWTEVYSGESSGKTLKLEPYSFAAVSARYVRIIGYGNTTSRWNSLTEVEIYGQQDTGELPEPEGVLPVQTVAASAWQAPNVPANTRDKALHTRWSAEHDGQWIAYDLETPKTVSQVAIAWYQGNQRQSFFTIEVSSNGTTWTEVYSGESSGKTLKLEPYSFAAVSARYVRIVGYGNTVNQWNSLTEVEIYGR